MEISLFLFLKYVRTGLFERAFLVSQLNWIFLIPNICLYSIFDLGECFQLLGVGNSYRLILFSFFSARFIAQFSN
jgi:hypothetical protein